MQLSTSKEHSMSYGHFDDARRQYVITDPLPPKPWINYLGNRRLKAFISQNAGGLLWHVEPQFRRITRYHYIPGPPDRPGFYLYLRDRRTGDVWNPHFAPACAKLDSFECRHSPGVTSFTANRHGVRAEITYTIPPWHDVMVWRISLHNTGTSAANLQAVSYIEFSLLEFMREIIGWCYLKNQLAFRYDPSVRAIRYDYHVFEAPFTPRMTFGCSAPVSGFDCARDAFIGLTGSLQRPAALEPGAELTGSELPLGGHGCGVLGVDVKLAAGEKREFAYVFAIGDTWEQTDDLLARFAQPGAADEAIRATQSVWESRLANCQIQTPDAVVNRFVNTWNPYNCAVTLDICRIISTDHMGLDGLRYRDTMQDALAGASFDADFARLRVRQILAQQTRDGGGCFAFWPDSPKPTTDVPHRSDNTVWPVYTIKALLAETGDMSFLDERIAFRDGGDATVYEHILLGLKHIYERRGPHGLPVLYHADWNDGLALFGDEKAETVMLGMQLVHSCREMAELADRLGREGDAEWCRRVADELTKTLNSDAVWDGRWYRRLLLSNGKVLGSATCRQGCIFLNPQSWSVISGVGAGERGRTAMEAAAELLDTPYGLRILDPPYRGIPEPEDPPLGSNPGVGENGGIFCHANTWAIIAETMLGNAERAFKYYRQLLPQVVSEKAGPRHYGREPYVYVSSIVGPASNRFGEGGISWLTGTASWMYVAVTQHILGIRPTLDGLVVQPCLPAALPHVRVFRRFRGCTYEIEIFNDGCGNVQLEIGGKPAEGNLVRPSTKGRVCVKCRC
jgi:cellobiose phosphorylase